MTKVVAVINQKGGVGKSTTACALAVGLANRGKKILLIDSDPQGNTTYVLGVNRTLANLYNVMNGTPAKDAIEKLSDNLDIITSYGELATADKTYTQTGREYILKKALQPIQDKYDYIIIDTPPALGILSINALTASYGVVIPVQADVMSIQGLMQLKDTIDTVREYTNPQLKILGILRTRHNVRTNISKETSKILDDIAHKLGTILYNTYIRESVGIREAQGERKDIFSFAPNNNAVLDYVTFLEEFEGQLWN